MPFLGKSGTSRISFLRCSQLAPTFTDTVFAITMLLQCEMNSGLERAWLLILQRHPLARREAPVAGVRAIQSADRACLWPALPRCHPHYCAPIQRRPAYGPRVLRTSENPRPARVHERRNVWPVGSGHRVIGSSDIG